MKSNATLKKIILCTMSLVVLLCLGIITSACSGKEEKIILIDDYDMPTAIVSREFDVVEMIEGTNGYEVELIECFYLDANMQRVDIPYNGLKFTPTVEKEVFITLKIKGGSLIKETTVSVVAPTTPIQEHFMSSWNQEGIGKTVTADPNYLPDDETESVIKVSYAGTVGTTISGPGIGGFYYNRKSELPFSVNNWSNAVLTMDVFNPLAVDLQIFYCIIKDNGTWTSDITGLYGQQVFGVLKAGEWTKCVLSLNMIGISENIYEKYDGQMYIAFRASYKVMPSTQPYEWTMYIANMDITDYSKEKFPNLETERIDQKLERLNGEDEDKNLYVHLLEENTDFRYAGTRTESDIVAYASLQGISKPEGTTSDYLIKYTIYANENDTDERGKAVFSTPIYYKNGNGYIAFNEDEAKIDYSLAEMSFDFYNDTGSDVTLYLVDKLSMYMSLTKYDKVLAKNGQWTKVQIPLYDLDIGSNYMFAISFEASNRCEYTSKNYYIDNFKIFEGDGPTIYTKLSDVESTLSTADYDFNSTNVAPTDNDLSWISVDEKEEKVTAGKKYLRVTVNFTEFNTSSASFVYASAETGAIKYKFNFGYRHGETDVFFYNDYSGGCIIGVLKNGGTALTTSALRVYLETLMVVNTTAQSTWTYYNTSSNYGVANGKFALGTDYVFEFELEKCPGNMLLNFGKTSVIKNIEWSEDAFDYEVYEPSNLSMVETYLSTNNTYSFESSNVDINGVAWLAVDDLSSQKTAGKKHLIITVNFTEFNTVSALFAYASAESSATKYKYSFGYTLGTNRYMFYNDYSSACIGGAFNSGGQAIGKGVMKIYKGQDLVFDTTTSAWTYYANSGRFVTGQDYIIDIDLEACDGNLLLNLGNTSVISNIEWTE